MTAEVRLAQYVAPAHDLGIRPKAQRIRLVGMVQDQGQMFAVVRKDGQASCPPWVLTQEEWDRLDPAEAA